MQPPEKAAVSKPPEKGLAWSSFAVVMLLGLVAAGGNAEGVFLFAPEGVFLACCVLVVCVCLVAIVLVESLAREGVVATYRHRRTGAMQFVFMFVCLMFMLHVTCVKGAAGSPEDEGSWAPRRDAPGARGRRGETPGSPGFMPDRSDTPNGDTSEDEGAAGARQRRGLTPGFPPDSPPDLAPRARGRAVTPPFIPEDVAARRRAMTPEYNPIGSPPDLAALPPSGWGSGGPTHNININVLNAEHFSDDEPDFLRAIENSLQDAAPAAGGAAGGGARGPGAGEEPCSLSAGGAHSSENYRGASAAASASVDLPARAAPRG